MNDEEITVPHLTLEYSANLADEKRIGELCNKLAHCLDAQRDGEQRVFPLGGIRVRALRCHEYCIADGRPDAAFLHANLKIAMGRSPCSTSSKTISPMSSQPAASRCRWRSTSSAKRAPGNTIISTPASRPERG
jgi:5-carboxymethyl-2-hydroxymuconate isomerase